VTDEKSVNSSKVAEVNAAKFFADAQIDVENINEITIKVVNAILQNKVRFFKNYLLPTYICIHE
jgi:hypothetical protein